MNFAEEEKNKVFFFLQLGYKSENLKNNRGLKIFLKKIKKKKKE